MWPFDGIGYQVSRAGNALANTFGGGVKTNPDEYDVWGIKKQAAPFTMQPAAAPAAPSGISLTNPLGFTGQAVMSNGYGIPNYDQTSGTARTGVTPSQAANMTPAQQGKMIDTIAYGQGQKSMNSSTPLASAPSIPNVGGSNSSTTGGPATPGGMSNYDAERLKLAQGRESAIQEAIKKINGLSNPYDTNSDAFKHTVADATNRATMQFAGADRAAQEALAGRGMMGTGYEAAGLGSLIGQRGAAISGAQNSLYADAYKGAGDFDMRRQSAILQALGGSNLDGVLGDLSSQGFQRQQLDDSQRNAVLTALAEAGIKYGPELLKYLGG
jgi:hypothetical protein